MIFYIILGIYWIFQKVKENLELELCRSYLRNSEYWRFKEPAGHWRQNLNALIDWLASSCYCSIPSFVIALLLTRNISMLVLVPRLLYCSSTRLLVNTKMVGNRYLINRIVNILNRISDWPYRTHNSIHRYNDYI